MRRREQILAAARWCFLNFGYAKTSLEDIARRANLSRTLLYKIFKNKEDIYTAVFEDWLIPRHPKAQQIAATPGPPYDRLLKVCQLMVVEPWSDMVDAPMGGEFFEACERIDASIDAHHRQVALDCITLILGNKEKSKVFILSLDGLLTDQPTGSALERRIQILASQFVRTEASEKNKK